MPEIILPNLHSGQIDIYRNKSRFNAVCCGRRYGKTILLKTIGADAGAKGKKVGIFTPEHKQWTEIYDGTLEILQPIKKNSSKNEGILRTTTGGAIDFWHINDNPLAGRGREYDVVLIDEAAFAKDSQSKVIWERAIKPTLLTTRGSAWVFSTPHGNSPESFFYSICNDEDSIFKFFHAPTASNPYVPADEIERERLISHPLVFEQEYLAKFVDWSGVQFFVRDNLLVNGEAVPCPQHVDYVYAVIDTAIKTGTDNDGTAVVYFSKSQFIGHPLVILGYDLLQIEGSLLETWLPSVYEGLEMYARETKSRFGSAGVWIEDKGSGTILLQQANRRGWVASPIDSELTALGKDERALSVSGYVHRGMIKIDKHAYDHTLVYKGQSKNHLMSQITGFRMGDKDAAKRADDLLDCFTYGISIGLGNQEGF